MANNENAESMLPPTPDPALRRLDKLLGTWRITGRTLGSQEDDISGHTTIEWLPGGFYLQQCGEMEANGFKLKLDLAYYPVILLPFPEMSRAREQACLPGHVKATEVASIDFAGDHRRLIISRLLLATRS